MTCVVVAAVVAVVVWCPFVSLFLSVGSFSIVSVFRLHILTQPIETDKMPSIRVQKEARKETKHAKPMAQLKQSRASVAEGTTVSSGCASFDQEMKTNFARMIADTKKRMEQQKKQQKNGSKKDTEQSFAPSVQQPRDKVLKKAPRTSQTDQSADSQSQLSSNPASATHDSNQSTVQGVAVSTNSKNDKKGSLGKSKHGHEAQPTKTARTTNATSKPNAKRPSSASNDQSRSSLSSRKRSKPSTSKAITASDTSSSVPTTTRSTPSILGQWTCSRCTFLNKNRIWSTARCEVCDFRRDKQQQQTQQQQQQQQQERDGVDQVVEIHS